MKNNERDIFASQFWRNMFSGGFWRIGNRTCRATVIKNTPIRGRPRGCKYISVLLVIVLIMEMAGCQKGSVNAENIIMQAIEDQTRAGSCSSVRCEFSESENNSIPGNETVIGAERLADALDSYAYSDQWLSSTINYDRLSVWGITHRYQILWVLSHNGMNQKKAAEELLNVKGYAETLLCALLTPLYEEKSGKNTSIIWNSEHKPFSSISLPGIVSICGRDRCMTTVEKPVSDQSIRPTLWIEPGSPQDILELLEEPARICGMETPNELVEKLADKLDSQTAGYLAVTYASTIQFMDLVSSLMDNARWKEAAEAVKNRYSEQFCKIIDETLSEESTSGTSLPSIGISKKDAMKSSIMETVNPDLLYKEARLEMEYTLDGTKDVEELTEQDAPIYGTDILIGLGGLVTNAGMKLKKAVSRKEILYAFSMYRFVRFAQYSGFLDIETEESRREYLKICIHDLQKMTQENPISAEPFKEGKQDRESPFIMRKHEDEEK